MDSVRKATRHPDLIGNADALIEITLPWSRDTLQSPIYRAFEAREGEASYPPVAQPFVNRHSKRKGNQGRVVSKFIRVAAAGTINAEGQSVASGL